MADTIRLTRRVCHELRDVQRAFLRSAASVSKLDIACHNRIEELLKVERSSNTVRGGRTLSKGMFYEPNADKERTFAIIRDLMLQVLGSCTQMQVRRALKRNITTLDEWSGTSAVESLGRIVQMRTAS